MILEPNTFEYNFLLTLTIILITGKFLLLAFVFKKVLEYNKTKQKFEIDFLFGGFILLLSLIISRIIFTYFDFVLTHFDSSKNHQYPNILFYKLGMISLEIGLSIFMFIVDKKALKFKFKGIFAYLLIAAAIFELLYPVNSAEDYEFLNIIDTICIFTSIALFPVIFFYLGIKNKKIRLIMLMFAFGIIFYAIGVIIQNEPIIGPLEQRFGTILRMMIWISGIALKLIGLTMISYSCTKLY